MQQSASPAQKAPSDPQGSGSTSVQVELAASQAYPRQHSSSDWQVSGLAHWARVAKVHCSEALFAVASESVQLHGGIAVTWEHDAQLYLKRAHGSAQLFGQPRSFVSALGVDALR